jgi:hypothetical protein
MREIWVNYILVPKYFFFHLYKTMILRAHETMCRSLAPFRIFTGVDSVQHVITWWSNVEIQLNLRNYWTISGKSQTWCFHHPRASASLRKSLRPIQHWNAHVPQNPREPKCIVMVRRKVPYTFVKHVDYAYIEMAWNFFGGHLHPNYGPTQDLSFFW